MTAYLEEEAVTIVGVENGDLGGRSTDHGTGRAKKYEEHSFADDKSEEERRFKSLTSRKGVRWPN